MKSVFISLIMVFQVSVSAQQIVSSNVYDRIFLVVQNVDEEGQFFVERVPMIGCYVLTHGARLIQFTSAYLAPSNVGCGAEMAKNEDINALSCARIVRSVESPSLMTYSAIEMDISGCPERNNPQFISMIRTAAKYNFPQPNNKREVQLTFVK